jgi:integrase
MAYFRTRGKKWHFSYIDAEGIRSERAGFGDRREMERLAARLEDEARRTRAGLVDPKATRHREQARRPLAEHLDDWSVALLAKGNTAKHAHMARHHARRLIGLAGAERVGDLSPSAVQGDLAARRDDKKKSLQTCNHALRAIEGFSRWMHRDGRMPDDPLAHLSAFNAKEDPRHERGALSDAEFEALCVATRAAGDFRGLSGIDRAMLYLVASYTGLRASELASLTTASFDLDSSSPSVRVAVAATKNRQGAILPIRPDLADLLRPLLAGRAAGAAVWPGSWAERSSEMLQADLARAGIPYVDAEGRYRDFHALRHRFGTALALANVPPKVAQSLMRHSSITLTMDRYSHAGLFDVAGALEKLPPLPKGGPPKSEPAALPATGTDGPVPASAANLRQGPRSLAVNHYTRRDSNPQPSVPKTPDHHRAKCRKTQETSAFYRDPGLLQAFASRRVEARLIAVLQGPVRSESGSWPVVGEGHPVVHLGGSSGVPPVLPVAWQARPTRPPTQATSRAHRQCPTRRKGSGDEFVGVPPPRTLPSGRKATAGVGPGAVLTKAMESPSACVQTRLAGSPSPSPGCIRAYRASSPAVVGRCGATASYAHGPIASTT